ncbi:MAG: hypothetical protein RMN24_11000, partial [Anaerolineae bacterium]|nr:hypothetical protein [Anaerolineae bacterium]
MPSRSRVFVLVLLLLFILGWLASRRERLPELGPQQVVITRNPKAGVYTRLENEVEAWKIKRTL